MKNLLMICVLGAGGLSVVGCSSYDNCCGRDLCGVSAPGPVMYDYVYVEETGYGHHHHKEHKKHHKHHAKHQKAHHATKTHPVGSVQPK